MLAHRALACACANLSVQEAGARALNKAARTEHALTDVIFQWSTCAWSVCSDCSETTKLVHSLLLLHSWCQESYPFDCSCGAHIFSRVSEILELASISVALFVMCYTPLCALRRVLSHTHTCEHMFTCSLSRNSCSVFIGVS